jgi:hypothetical protein
MRSPRKPALPGDAAYLRRTRLEVERSSFLPRKPKLNCIRLIRKGKGLPAADTDASYLSYSWIGLLLAAGWFASGWCQVVLLSVRIIPQEWAKGSQY